MHVFVHFIGGNDMSHLLSMALKKREKPDEMQSEARRTTYSA